MNLEEASGAWKRYVDEEKYAIIRKCMKEIPEHRWKNPPPTKYKKKVVKKAWTFFHKDLPTETFHPDDAFRSALYFLQIYVAQRTAEKLGEDTHIYVDKVEGWIDKDPRDRRFDIFLGKTEEGEFREPKPLVQFILKLTVSLWDEE